MFGILRVKHLLCYVKYLLWLLYYVIHYFICYDMFFMLYVCYIMLFLFLEILFVMLAMFLLFLSGTSSFCQTEDAVKLIYDRKKKTFLFLSFFIGKSQSETRLINNVFITPIRITTYNSLHQKHILKTSWVCNQLCLARWQLVNHMRQLLNTKGNSQKTIWNSFYAKSYFIRVLPIWQTSRQITVKTKLYEDRQNTSKHHSDKWKRYS
jgi:hypothetical protein